MIRKIRKLLKLKDGQGMTEYIIIVALIAIAAIGVVTLFGNNIRELFANSAEALTGATNVQNKGKKASTQMIKKDLKSFGKNNKAP